MDDDSGLIEEPVYLILEDALEIYAAIIGATAAQAADHLRSRDALEGALARPAQYAHYQQADLALQAAVLAHGIAAAPARSSSPRPCAIASPALRRAAERPQAIVPPLVDGRTG